MTDNYTTKVYSTETLGTPEANSAVFKQALVDSMAPLYGGYTAQNFQLLHQARPMAICHAGGGVEIFWDRVDDVIAQNDVRNPLVLSMAKLLRAARLQGYLGADMRNTKGE